MKNKSRETKDFKRRTAECTSCKMKKHADDFETVELSHDFAVGGYGICKNCDSCATELKRHCFVCLLEKHVGDFPKREKLKDGSGKCNSCRGLRKYTGSQDGRHFKTVIKDGVRLYRCKECNEVKKRSEFERCVVKKGRPSCITGRCLQCAALSKAISKEINVLEAEYWKTHKKSEGNVKVIDDAVDVISLRIIRKHADARMHFTDSGKVRLSGRKYWTVAAEEKSKTMARFIAEEEIDEIHERMVLLGMTPNDLLTPVSEEHIGVEF